MLHLNMSNPLWIALRSLKSQRNAISRSKILWWFNSRILSLNQNQSLSHVLLLILLLQKDSTWKAPSCTYTAGVQTNGPSYPGVDNEYEFNEFIKLKSRKTTYSASTGDIGDITTGSLFIIFIASQGNVWQCNWTARLRFYDN